MSEDVDACERKVEALLGLAAKAANPNERSQLISEAVYWSWKGEEAARAARPPDGHEVIPWLRDPRELPEA
jgi:hypothetical protein